MPIKYLKTQRKMPGNPTVKKWYPAAAPRTLIGLADITQGIVDRCTLTAPDILAVLRALQEVVIEQLTRGNAVKFGDLGIINFTLKSHFYNKAEGVYGTGGRDVADTVYDTDGTTVKTQGVTNNDIKGISVRFYPDKAIKYALQRNKLKFEYTGVKKPLL